MEFEQKKRKTNNEENYHIENLKIAREFSKDLLGEMNEFVRSIVLFGSNTHDTLKKNSDIDLMIVLDNVSVFVSEELREAYKIITKKISGKHSNRLHLLTVNLSDLWDMSRKGDPLLINILRHGIALFDRDLVEPMQYLLEIGRIKPTREAVYNYISRSETLLNETNKIFENAVMDLYYSVVDMIHATLMAQGITPMSPKEMPKIFKKVFSGKKISVYSKDIEVFYKLVKDIEYKKIKNISGKEYDNYFKKASKLIENLSKFNTEELKKKDIFDI